MNTGSYRLRPGEKGQRGYALLIMLLLTALLAIAAAAAAPSITFQLRREREEELVHRGVQYSRAIRRYAKKTGRYPLTLQDLMGDGNIRYIRRLYKDPLTGKDFRLLHQADIPLPGSIQSANGSGVQAPGNPEPVAVSHADSTSDSNSQDRANQEDSTPEPSGAGLLIFGVASRSRAPSIREFNHKGHYNQWLFFYDPHFDQGHELTGPTPLVVAPPVQAQPHESAPSNETQPQDTQETPQ
jgi:type II secretory pathway pseudopilin PulG